MEISGKAAIVTGSSSGIGAATARLLASHGCNVVVNYARSADAAKKVGEECEALGADVIVCQADVAEDADCRRMVAEAVERWGRLDVVVNNAGTTKFNAHDNLGGLDKDDFFHIYGVNLVGPYQMIRAAEPHLRAAGQAAVVNVASIAGVAGVGSSVAYAASKGALITMTLSLARVLGPEIRVNTVCPGFVQGEWLREGLGAETYDAALANLRRRTPLQDAATPETVAQTIYAFVCHADLVTGETMIVDGGNHLGMVVRTNR